MENLPRSEKLRLTSDFLLFIMVDRGGAYKKNDNDWKFQINKGTNLGCDMLCESVISDQEGKEGDLLNGNCIINQNNLITNIDNVLLCKVWENERAL